MWYQRLDLAKRNPEDHIVGRNRASPGNVYGAVGGLHLVFGEVVGYGIVKAPCVAGAGSRCRPVWICESPNCTVIPGGCKRDARGCGGPSHVKSVAGVGLCDVCVRVDTVRQGRGFAYSEVEG